MTGSPLGVIICPVTEAYDNERSSSTLMLTIIERTEGHYDVQEVDFGRVYRWCPECVSIECECGERLSLTASSTAACPRCGANHAATIREELPVRRLEDQTLHPWRYDTSDLEDAALPC
jgi:hypothetical protein